MSFNKAASVPAQSSNPAPQQESELDRLRRENAAMKAKLAARGTISMKVSEKGALSIYGLGRFPVTLYKGQWLRLISVIAQIKSFIEEHTSELADKES